MIADLIVGILIVVFFLMIGVTIGVHDREIKELQERMDALEENEFEEHVS